MADPACGPDRADAVNPTLSDREETPTVSTATENQQQDQGLPAKEIARLEQAVAQMRAADEADQRPTRRASRGPAGPVPASPETIETLMSNPNLAKALARIESDPGAAAEADASIAQADRDALTATDRNRRQARWNEYTSNRPGEFADSCYDRLKAQQDPDGRVSRWWQSGHRTLLLVGPARKGKTDAGYTVCNEVAAADREGGPGDRSVRVKAWSMIELLKATDWPDAHQRYDETWTARRERIERYVHEAELVLLDDPGRERVDEKRREALHGLLDHRVHEAGTLRTIITMNVDTPANLESTIEDKYGSAVLGRIKQGAVAAWIEGDTLGGYATWDPFS